MGGMWWWGWYEHRLDRAGLDGAGHGVAGHGEVGRL